MKVIFCLFLCTLCTFYQTAIATSVNTAKVEACLINGVVYLEGDHVPNVDPCQNCVCEPELPDQQLCTNLTCLVAECEEGKELHYLPYQCCPVCAEVCHLVNGTYFEGDPVPSDDPCKECICDPDGPDQRLCIDTPCTEIPMCGSYGTVNVSGECCPKCPTCDVVGPNYKTGDKLPSDDPCNKECYCNEEGRIQCEYLTQIIDCGFPGCPEGKEPQYIPDVCCPVCMQASCKLDGAVYALGASMPSDDPCEILCFCGQYGEAICATVDCYTPKCPEGAQLTYLTDQCCPVCIPTGCELNNTIYPYGSPMLSEDPCEEDCICAESGVRICAITDCPDIECVVGQKLESLPDKCCDVCVPLTGGCVEGETTYAVGDSMPTVTPCEFGCVCGKSGARICAIIDCPFLDCPSKQKIEPGPDQCCPVCAKLITAPDCSYQYCGENGTQLCTKTDALSNCTNKVTSCNACYFSEEERALPAECNDAANCEGLSVDKMEKCLLNWSECVGKSFDSIYGETPDSLLKEEFFKCLQYPCSD